MQGLTLFVLCFSMKSLQKLYAVCPRPRHHLNYPTYNTSKIS